MTLPAITISEKDREQLMSVATAAISGVRPAQGASMLLSEIGRATVVVSLPKGVVNVHSDVEFLDHVDKVVARAHLVYPDDAMAGTNSISVLTPPGSGIDWLVGRRFDQLVHSNRKRPQRNCAAGITRC
jgi:transcription elongation GreA/GreB family factor